MAASTIQGPRARALKPEPTLSLQTLDQAIGHRGRPMNVPLSLCLHTFALTGLVAIPVLTPSESP